MKNIVRLLAFVIAMTFSTIVMAYDESDRAQRMEYEDSIRSLSNHAVDVLAKTYMTEHPIEMITKWINPIMEKSGDTPQGMYNVYHDIGKNMSDEDFESLLESSSVDPSEAAFLSFFEKEKAMMIYKFWIYRYSVEVLGDPIETIH